MVQIKSVQSFPGENFVIRNKSVNAKGENIFKVS